MDISPLSTIARPWWRDITRPEWYALAAAHAGLALDAFDVMLYAFVLSTIMGEWKLKPATAGFVASVTLFASAFGGMIFGAVANRLGRKKTLMIRVMVFSVCSGLSGLAQNVVQLAIARTALGLGYGGEWTSGALLVSETWRAEHRGKAIAIMQRDFRWDRSSRRSRRRPSSLRSDGAFCSSSAFCRRCSRSGSEPRSRNPESGSRRSTSPEAPLTSASFKSSGSHCCGTRCYAC